MASKVRIRDWAIGVAKYAVSFGLIGYLAYGAWTDESFHDLSRRSIDWPALAGAFVVGLASTVMTFVRWRLLVTALGMPFRYVDAIALGFIGHLFTFFTVGVVGGDVVKAYYLARQRPDRKAEAISTVILDRVAGLFALFFVALFGYAYLIFVRKPDLAPEPLAALHAIGLTSLVVCVVATLGVALAVGTRVLSHAALDRVERLPLIGRAALDVLGAVRTYRTKPGVAAAVFLMSVATHLGFTFAVWMTARGLSYRDHSFGEHVVIVPTALLANSVPLPAGLGAFEVALDYLYRAFGDESAGAREGFIVAFAYRLMTIAYALFGVYFYLTRRRQVDGLFDQAGDKQAPLHLDPDEVEQIDRHVAEAPDGDTLSSESR